MTVCMSKRETAKQLAQQDQFKSITKSRHASQALVSEQSTLASTEHIIPLATSRNHTKPPTAAQSAKCVHADKHACTLPTALQNTLGAWRSQRLRACAFPARRQACCEPSKGTLAPEPRMRIRGLRCRRERLRRRMHRRCHRRRLFCNMLTHARAGIRTPMRVHSRNEVPQMVCARCVRERGRSRAAVCMMSCSLRGVAAGAALDRLHV